MQTLATFTDIDTSIKSTRTWFSTDTPADSTQRFQRWSYSTRDNGDIENETPGGPKRMPRPLGGVVY